MIRIETERSSLLWYVIAVAVTVAAALLRLLSISVFGPTIPYIFYFPAVVVTALFGGLGPGLLSVLLSILAAILLSRPVLHAPGPQELVSVVLFAVVSCGMVG